MKPYFANHKNCSFKNKQARKLRQSGSIIEKMLRHALRAQPGNFDIKFRYQHPIDPYIADFACLSVRLIVEIDGLSHDLTYEADEKRQVFLEQQGFSVLRFTNEDVLKNTEGVVMDMYKKACELRSKLRNSDIGMTPPRMR